ncbi:MAG: alpha-glucosidase, partial [Pseudorhodobacter sp.]|nr:alpha-glucosidase [Pseudorhodobacter sp.]
FFGKRIHDFFTGRPNAWPMWAFSNHDVVRLATRWARFGASQDALAKQAGTLLLSFQGSICLWQGDELGQTDTALSFDELTDPQGINFWPEPVGRDNTRTPMVWDDSVNAGFSRGNGKPWLPVKAPQLARNVKSQLGVHGSVLETYRSMIAWRKANRVLLTGDTVFHDLPEPILAFTRGGQLLCVFNLSPDARTVTITGTATLTGPSLAADLHGQTLRLGPNAAAILTVTGDITLTA